MHELRAGSGSASSYEHETPLLSYEQGKVKSDLGTEVLATGQSWRAARTFFGWYWPSAASSSVVSGSSTAMASSPGTMICRQMTCPYLDTKANRTPKCRCSDTRNMNKGENN
jgi:hypothetical protein